MPEENWRKILDRLLPAEPPYPPLPRFLFEGSKGHSVWVAGQEVDSSLEVMKERYKSKWRKKGYSESLIGMASELSDHWAESMAEAFAPPEAPEVKKAIVKHIYPKALKTSDVWITALGEAAEKSKTV